MPVGAELRAVDVDAYFPLVPPHERDLTDAGELREPGLDPVLHELVELARGHRRGDPHAEDGKLVERELRNYRRLGVLREIVEDFVHLPLGVLQRRGDVRRQVELDLDERDPFARGAAHGRDLVDAGDRVLDGLGDGRFDLVRRRPRVHRRDRHERGVDLRQELVLELAEPEDAQDGKRREYDDDKRRSFNRKLGKCHVFPSREMFFPSRPGFESLLQDLDRDRVLEIVLAVDDDRFAGAQP